MMTRAHILPCLLLLATAVRAEAAEAENASAGLDAASMQALMQTQQLLKSPADRDKALKGDARAQSADQQAKAAGGGSAAGTEAVYGLSSEVFDGLVKETGGDTTKLQELITQANQNPQAFYEKHFSAANKAKLQELARQPAQTGLAPTSAAAPTSAGK